MAPNNQRLRTVGVVLAGGVGARVGLLIPKQLLKIAGKPIIEHTLTAFEAAPEIDEILVMMTPGYVDDVKAIVAEREIRFIRLWFTDVIGQLKSFSINASELDGALA